MNLLAVDASSENISLAVMWRGEVIFDYNRRIRYGASRLVSYIDKCIHSLSLDLKKIDAFVVERSKKFPESAQQLRVMTFP